MRHDWFPIVPSLRFAATLTGWDPTGLGNVIGYPASFELIFARSIVASIVGAYATHLLFFASHALLLVFGAARLVRVLGGPPVARVAGALFAAFNPWTYTELVAGHAFMTLSYAAMFWLIAECCVRSRAPLRLALLAIPIAPQVQFLLVCAPIYAWLAVRTRSWAVLLAIGSMLLPVVVGILMSRDVLLGIPITLEWEKGQSIDPFRAVILRGYFTSYDTVLAPFYEWSLWVVVGIACIGVLTILIVRRRDAWLVAFTTLPLLASFGAIGPFAAIFSWVITHVTEAGLFRELYDLLGFVAIGYVAFCAIAAARLRLLGLLWLGAGLAMLAAWIIAPPQQYWVASRTLPVTPIANAPNTRFLLLPPVYPARLTRTDARSSGTDPELYPRADGIDPVNEAMPMYPLSTAIARYLRDGTTDGLGALSVTEIVGRPWLDTDQSVKEQLALPAPDWLFAASRKHSESIADAVPELSIGALPAIATLARNVGAGNVLFGDAVAATGDRVPAVWGTFASVRPVVASNRFVSASDGWVDARLAFVEDPDLGQTYGGALTTNASAVLPIVPNTFALVYVRGKLLADDGSAVTAATDGYRWVFVPAGARGLTCAGLCVVAAQAARVPDAPRDPPARASDPVTFRSPMPWLVLATLPPGDASLLRYNSTFDSKWTALYGRTSLAHVRVDGVVNGWLVPSRTEPTHVLLVEVGAAAISLSELAAVLILASVLYYAFRTRVAARAVAIDATAISERTM